MKYYRWVLWSLFVIIVTYFIGFMATKGYAGPEEPWGSVEVVEVWTHPSLGVVLEYEDGQRFTHAKKGTVEKAPASMERGAFVVYQDAAELWYVTEGGVLYRMWLAPDFYFDRGLGEAGRYISMIEKTWPPRRCACE